VTELIYVYAILAEPPAALPRGIDGQPVRTIDKDGMYAAVGDVPEAEFNEEALNAGMAYALAGSARGGAPGGEPAIARDVERHRAAGLRDGFSR